MKKTTRNKARKQFQIHAAIQRQLRRLKVDPGKTPEQTATNLKVFVDTLLDLMQRPPAPPAPAEPTRVVPVADEPGTTPTEQLGPGPQDESKDNPEPESAADPSDWRAVLGIAHGANVSPITLRAALQANIHKPGSLFAYQLAKAELGIF